MTYSTFAAHLNETFTAAHGPASVELTLTECVPLTTHPAPTDAPRQSFSLTFQGPVSAPLPQQIHTLHNPTLGQIHLFLVPLGPTGATFEYQAIFN